MSDCDVLIVGSGPVGTALAVELAAQDISFRIVDKCPVRCDKSRAFIIQPRTLELLSRHGAERVHDLVSQGNVIHGANFFVNKRQAARIPLDDIGTTDTAFPLPLMASQAKMERLLDDILASYGKAVERPVTAKSITQDSEGVTSVLELADGSQQTVRSKYIVGCDGAHSFVRKSAENLTWEGAQYPQDFVLCDAFLKDSNLIQTRFSLFLGNGLLALFPLGNGIFRLIASGKKTENENDAPSLEDFQGILDKFAPPGSGVLVDPVWRSRFRLHHRGVNSYRDGRIFVAGDAAHIHSPSGGQGMNTGMQDSINLGWKLAAVLQGKTANPEALLDSYHAERHPVGLDLLRGTDQLFSFGASTDTWFISVRNFVLPWVLPWVASSVMLRRRFFQYVSEFGVRYRDSPLVATAYGFSKETSVLGGDRLPDGKLYKALKTEKSKTSIHTLCAPPKKHHLLFFAGTGAGDLASEVRAKAIADASAQVPVLLKDDLDTHVIYPAEHSLSVEAGYVDAENNAHTRYGFAKPSYALVRPDGYIAHVGPLSEVGKALVAYYEFLA